MQHFIRHDCSLSNIYFWLTSASPESLPVNIENDLPTFHVVEIMFVSSTLLPLVVEVQSTLWNYFSLSTAPWPESVYHNTSNPSSRLGR